MRRGLKFGTATVQTSTSKCIMNISRLKCFWNNTSLKIRCCRFLADVCTEQSIHFEECWWWPATYVRTDTVGIWLCTALGHLSTCVNWIPFITFFIALWVIYNTQISIFDYIVIIIHLFIWQIKTFALPLPMDYRSIYI